ncbi:MAG: Uma2 family endonuclease [Chloroflexi bacterium]|nr:Uma2 family endonuclease [Chloroflexota bacterium]
MTTAKKLMTADELFLMPDDGRRYELVEGELVEMTPPGNVHGKITLLVGSVLLAFVRLHQLGEVATGDPGIIIRRSPDVVRGPDVYFIRNERIPAGGLPAAYMDIVPDLIVEVVSPGDTATEVLKKVGEWLAAGARLVWAVYPELRTVVAYRSLHDIHAYGPDDTLDAEPVLPGFACPVAKLFA